MIVHKFMRDLDGFRPRIVVHVGANRAAEADVYERAGAGRVVWIEADPEVASRARHKLLKHADGPTRHEVVCALVTDVDGAPTRFNVFSNGGASSSVFQATAFAVESWPQARETGEVKLLSSSRLDTLLASVGASPGELDVLVLDVQGAELLALKGAGPYLRTALLVEVELSTVAFYEGAPLADEVDAFLLEAGLTRLTDIPLHGDALYVRADRLSPSAFERLQSRGRRLADWRGSHQPGAS